jgi:hypothetical protein
MFTCCSQLWQHATANQGAFLSNNYRTGLFVAMVAILATIGHVPAEAHHATTKFDARRVVKITGVVTGVHWKNPHILIEIGPDTELSGGSRWTVELKAPRAMTREGWKRELLAVGDRITMFANPLRKDDSAAASRLVMYVGIVFSAGNALGCVDGAPCAVKARLR